MYQGVGCLILSSRVCQTSVRCIQWRSITYALLKLKLLKQASEAFLISSSQLTKGFFRLAESLNDLFFYIPLAKFLFESLSKAVPGGWFVPPSIAQLKTGMPKIIQNMRR